MVSDYKVRPFGRDVLGIDNVNLDSQCSAGVVTEIILTPPDDALRLGVVAASLSGSNCRHILKIFTETSVNFVNCNCIF